jgi:ATP-dependent Zn protease
MRWMMNKTTAKQIIVIAAVILVVGLKQSAAVEFEKMAYDTFIEHLQAGKVANVDFIERNSGNEIIAAFVSSGVTNKFSVNTSGLGTRSDPLLNAELQKAGIEPEVISERSNPPWSQLIVFLLPTFLWYAFPLATLILVIMIYRKVRDVPKQKI